MGWFRLEVKTKLDLVAAFSCGFIERGEQGSSNVIGKDRIKGKEHVTAQETMIK